MVSQVERIFNLTRDQAPRPGQPPRPPRLLSTPSLPGRGSD